MTDPRARIVVGYDGSTGADAALRWSAADVTGRGPQEPAPELQVVIAATSLDPVLGIYRVAKDAALEHWRADAAHLLESLGVVGHRIDVRRGRAVDELIATSRGAALLVLGTGDHRPWTGSVPQHVARHASCPVVVVRPPRAGARGHRIVVGTDGSPEAAAALRFACDRARRTGEEVTAIYGYWSPVDHVLTFDGARSDLADRHQREAEALVAEACAAAGAAFPDVTIEPEAIPVRPGQVLVDASGSASLVVVGSRGRGAFSGLLLGSVSQHVLDHGHCSVAIVR